MFYVVKKVQRVSGALVTTDVGYVSSAADGASINTKHAAAFEAWKAANAAAILSGGKSSVPDFFTADGQLIYTHSEVRTENADAALPLIADLDNPEG